VTSPQTHRGLKQPPINTTLNYAASNVMPTTNVSTRKQPIFLKTSTNTISKEGDKITLLWVPSHVRIPENEKADSAAREAHAEYLNRTKEYPPHD
jgi:ribonuclease HI